MPSGQVHAVQATHRTQLQLTKSWNVGSPSWSPSHNHHLYWPNFVETHSLASIAGHRALSRLLGCMQHPAALQHCFSQFSGVLSVFWVAKWFLFGINRILIGGWQKLIDGDAPGTKPDYHQDSLFLSNKVEICFYSIHFETINVNKLHRERRRVQTQYEEATPDAHWLSSNELGS